MVVPATGVRDKRAPGCGHVLESTVFSCPCVSTDLVMEQHCLALWQANVVDETPGVSRSVPRVSRNAPPSLPSPADVFLAHCTVDRPTVKLRPMTLHQNLTHAVIHTRSHATRTSARARRKCCGSPQIRARHVAITTQHVDATHFVGRGGHKRTMSMKSSRSTAKPHQESLAFSWSAV